MLFNCAVRENAWESLRLSSDMDSMEIKLVNQKGNQSWIFIGSSDAKGKAPILWPLDVKNWILRKDPHFGKDWRQEEKGTTEDEMVGWYHQFEQALGFGDGQRSPGSCSSPWGYKGLDMTERLTWSELKLAQFLCQLHLKLKKEKGGKISSRNTKHCLNS